MHETKKGELAEVAAKACKQALNRLPFDARCLDWASYTPDFFIDQKEIKAA